MRVLGFIITKGGCFSHPKMFIRPQIPILAAFSTAIALLLYGYIFILYNNSEKQDRELGLETSSVYLFCPRCGFPNAHKDFCVKCGKKLLKDKVNV